MAMQTIEVGQIVYVTEEGFYESKPNLREYKVTKVNGSSFYAYLVDSESIREKRFDRKKMICKTGYGYTLTAFITAEEYWNIIELGKEKKQLRSDIKYKVDTLNIIQLRQVNEFIKNLG